MSVTGNDSHPNSGKYSNIETICLYGKYDLFQAAYPHLRKSVFVTKVDFEAFSVGLTFKLKILFFYTFSNFTFSCFMPWAKFFFYAMFCRVYWFVMYPLAWVNVIFPVFGWRPNFFFYSYIYTCTVWTTIT